MKFITNLFTIVTIFVANMLMAQPAIPQDPPNPGSGAGVVGPGSAAVPIDQFSLILFVLAILLVFYYSAKTKEQTI